MGRQVVELTLAVPGLDPTDAEVVVTRNTLRLKSRRDAATTHYVVPLPVAVEPGRYVLRHLNGVYDFSFARASS